MTYGQRFFSLPAPSGGYYAPSTIGAPQCIVTIDYSVFKQDLADKQRAKDAKQHWKNGMIRYYGEKWKDYDNIPETLN